MKKRYWVLLCVVGMILLSVIPFLKPVRPYIQLAGEVYPGTEGLLFGTGLTNTFVASLVAYIILIVIALRLRAGSRTADEIPTGFYNFFEMVIEFAYSFAEGIVGSKKIKDFFPFFMTYILFILIANWTSLIPGWDSIGLWEHEPHFEAVKAAEEAGLHGEEAEEFIHEVEVEVDEENAGGLRNGFLLLNAANADAEADVEHLGGEHEGEGAKIGLNPEAADWTIVPFLRPAATDMNLTLAFAIIAMVMVQFYGFKYLGVSGYLSKFFPFIKPGFVDSAVKDPVKILDPVVGILELVSEVSKVISFAFRLLGNIFAGMVLLFVMASLVPVANVAFFGLEFFVGLIQAIVFALLMLIFMSSATESHDHGDGDHH